MMKYDVIVVGAGTAGCTFARHAAEAGLKVCLIDRKKSDKIGRKVCGDAIGRHHFDEVGLDPPKGEELERRVEGVDIYSPNKKVKMRFRGEGIYGYIINRYLFGQRLLNMAVNSGVILEDSTQVLEPIIKDGFVVGISALKDGGKVKFHGKVIIDASGYNAVLRRKLPQEMGIQNEVSKEDVIICYREIRELERQLENPNYLRIYLNLETAPGGYVWAFPEGDNKLNVGLGVVLADGYPNPKTQLYNKVLRDPIFNGSVLHGGGGHVPTRRPLDTMVGNGIILVGDSACQVNPIHGGGIGPSMIGGMIAAKTVVKALEVGDVGRRGLWVYNVDYNLKYGAKQAGLDVFRIFLQKLRDEDLDYGMEHRLITEEDLLKASMGVGEGVRLNITEKATRVFRGLGKLAFLMKLRTAANLMKQLKRHYMDYPETPEKFDEWRLKASSLIEEAKRKL